MDSKAAVPVSIMAMLLLATCGGGGSSAPTAPPTLPTVSPQVAGQYDVVVRLTENSCGAGVTVLAQPTTVTQSAGAPEFTLVHGGLRVTGSVSRDGTMTTPPLNVQDPQGPATLSITGRFTNTGLEATVTVEVLRAAPDTACRYLVAWTGTKQGSPNVLG